MAQYSPRQPASFNPTGATREETEANMYEAIELHLEGLEADHLPIPNSESVAEYIVVRRAS